MRYRVVLLALLVVASSFFVPFDAVNAAVGRTAGRFHVSSSGAATYNIPIWIPPGPRGIQPNLSIAYNSLNGSGSMGPGWSLSGLGAIDRCNKTYSQDAAPTAVSLATTDGYCLNGSRLRLVSGAYGAAGSTYQTEIADFGQIIAYSTAGNGPSYFVVQGKNGLISQYGNSNDGGSTYPARVAASGASTPYRWLLNKVSDRAGNNYIVTYGTGQSGSVGIGVPLSLSYTRTSVSGGGYNYSVEFTYGTDTAAGTESSYVSGGTTLNNNRLLNITVKASSAVIRKYNLGYETSPTTSRYRLNSVIECSDASLTDCLSPTLISYQNGGIGVSATNNTVLSGTTSVKGNYDLNGDGRQDILYVSGSALYVVFATSSGYGSAVSTGITLASGDLYEAGDLVASGRDDIIVSSGGYWYRYYWTGSGFSGVSTGLAKDSSDGTGIFLADMNGDGLPDLFTGTLSGTSSQVNVRLNTSTGSTLSLGNRTTVFQHSSNAGLMKLGTVTASPGKNSVIRVLDFNGDGKQDLVFTVRSSQLQPTIKVLGYNVIVLLSTGSGFTFGYQSPAENVAVYPVGYTDINDDACTDLIYSTVILVSACSGNGASTISYSGTFLGTMDWNGDKRTDLLVNSSDYVGVYLSTGTGLGGLTGTSIPVGGSALVFDQDGDGLDDLGYIGTSSPYAVSYYLHNGASTPPDMATSITDGYGVANSPAYVSIAQSGVYTKAVGATQPEKDIQTPRYVVSQVSSSDGIGGSYTQSYSYSGARQDIGGRGFLGFQSRTIADSRTDAAKVTTYSKTAFPYTGMVYQQDLFQNNGTTLISRTVNTPSLTSLDTTVNNQRYFLYASSTTTDSYEVGGIKNGQWITSSSASFNYDNYGNVTSSTSTVTDKDSVAPQSPTYTQAWTQVVTNTISPDTGNWCLDIPTQTTVQQYSTGVSLITRTASFTPDYANCRITQQVVEPSSSTYKVTTDYGFDSFGNVNSQTVTGISMVARPTTTNWGTTGQFPESITNTEGHYTQAGYNYNLGVQTSSTDVNGLVTGWTYDNFGLKLTESRPNGTSTTWSYNNCTGVSGGCQNGDPASSSTGINKMVVIATEKDNGSTTIRDNWTYLDQLHRTIVTKSKALSGGYTRVGVQYDALGRLYRQTSPCDASSCSVYWATNTYDALGRVTASTRPISASNTTLQSSTNSYLGLTTVITDPQSKTKTQVVDPNGWLRQSQDHDGYYQVFTYDAFGSLVAVNDAQSNALFRAAYDYGLGAFQRRTNDLDLGKVSLSNLNDQAWFYTVNALGEVTSYTDANSNTFSMTYDKLSRPLTRYVAGEGTTTWAWGTSSGAYNIGKLQSLTSTGGTTQTYSYDNKSRLSQKDITADGTTYSYNYAYNALGQPDTLQYPTSTSSYRLQLKYVYQNSVLQQVKDNAAGTVFWQADAANARGQVIQQTLGNGIVTSRSYDAVTGWLNSVQSGIGGGTGVQNESYLWDNAGNLTQRQNNTLGLTESFYYDNLYRLDYSQLNGATNLDMTYDALGRITNRSDVASNACVFRPSRPLISRHAGPAISRMAVQG